MGVPSSLNTKGQDIPSKALGYHRSYSLEGDIHFCPDLLEQALLLANKRGIIRNIEHTFQNIGFQRSEGLGSFHGDRKPSLRLRRLPVVI